MHLQIFVFCIDFKVYDFAPWDEWDPLGDYIII